MKPVLRITNLVVFFFSLILLACSGNKPAETTADSTAQSTPASTPSSSDYTGACIWDQVPLRETPDDKGKFKSSISIGQEVTLFIDTAGNGKVYTKVRLSDGTEGYAKNEFIVPNGKPSVFMNDADTYSHPDLLNKNKDKKFSKYDIVAVVTSQGDFLEVKGKRAGGKWIETDYIKNGNISDDKLNIATAKFIKQALLETDKDKRVRALQEILDNRDLSGAPLYAELQGMIDELNGVVPADSVSNQ